jgi:hypothetical protein
MINSNQYAGFDWNTIDKRLESADFKYKDFIDAAHSKGLKVMQDGNLVYCYILFNTHAVYDFKDSPISAVIYKIHSCGQPLLCKRHQG